MNNINGFLIINPSKTFQFLEGLKKAGNFSSLSIFLTNLIQAGEVELVGVPLAVDLGHNVLVVVVAQRTTQLVVVHVGLRLALPPAARHLVWVDQLKLALRALPGDAGGVGGVGEKLQEELP